MSLRGPSATGHHSHTAARARSSPWKWCNGLILRCCCQALSSRAVSGSVFTSFLVSSTAVRRQRCRTSRPR
ncbi:hypothetical protein ACFFX0_32905 [Citricoccus parietis]|uniref:Uncharacterized protein n=1 Tax=Citricoccus parietis TaxID=592307 RepID=A0ABV5G8G9_9MICC